MSDQPTPQQSDSQPAQNQQQGQTKPAPQQSSGTPAPVKPQIIDWASI